MRVRTMAQRFGPHALHAGQIFFESPLSVGIVNLKPIVLGHVLVISKRVCGRVADLSPEEVADLFATVHRVAPVLERHYGCSAMNIAIQDGADAGQSVPHVHIHLLPRRKGDFERNDEVHEKLDVFGSEFRQARSIEVMSEEASTLSKLFT
ncbi:unnamed protein product, partial [Ectocarpus fasciculatus]